MSSGTNVFFGDNAQGKTNVLEAICFAVGESSFRAQRLEEVVRIGESAAQIRATFEAAGLTSSVRVTISRGSRRMIKDDKLISKGNIKGFGTVLFSPEDMGILKAAPQGRRTLLDNAVSTAWAPFNEIRQGYQRALRQRNHLLKQNDSSLPVLVKSFDEQLIKYGSRLISARLRYLEDIRTALQDQYREISGADEHVRWFYRAQAECSLDTSVEVLEGALSRLLEQSWREDVRRATTTVGPHRDDIEVRINGQALREYGSQGQIRSAMLAFKLAQMANFSKIYGYFPILLLDDVSSELDPTRNAQLFAIIEKIKCQRVITTTRPELISISKKHKQFRVVKGQIGVPNSIARSVPV